MRRIYLRLMSSGRARSSARTISGIRTMWRIIPGTAVVKAPVRKAAQVKAEPVTPEKITRTIPQMMRPQSMAASREI